MPCHQIRNINDSLTLKSETFLKNFPFRFATSEQTNRTNCKFFLWLLIQGRCYSLETESQTPLTQLCTTQISIPFPKLTDTTVISKMKIFTQKCLFLTQDLSKSLFSCSDAWKVAGAAGSWTFYSNASCRCWKWLWSHSLLDDLETQFISCVTAGREKNPQVKPGKVLLSVFYHVHVLQTKVSF